MTAGILLAGSGVLSLAATSIEPEPVGADPLVRQLQVQNETKDDQLLRLRQLFTYCRQSVNWSDERCATPGTSARGSSLSVSDPVRIVRDSDDDDDGDTTVVVQAPRPSTTPRGSQRPGPETYPDTFKRTLGPDRADSGGRGTDRGRDNQDGSRGNRK